LDVAEPMVNVVRERAQSLGLEQVEARVIDAEDLHLDATSSTPCCAGWATCS